MPGPYIDAPTLKTAVAAMLKKDSASLKGYWDTIIGEAVTAGWSDLNGRLLGKGYTSGQLDGWDDRVRFNLDQSTFWALVRGAGLGGYEDRDYSKLDHRKEIEQSATIMIGGVAVAPGATNPGFGVEVGVTTFGNTGINYGTTFGLRTLRRNGMNQYGDSSVNPMDGGGDVGGGQLGGG